MRRLGIDAMTVFSDEVRDAVLARAGARCEYCHLSTRGQVATFPIDHVVPRSGGGETILANLALACPHCNAHKWVHTTGTDPVSGASLSLFNPRHRSLDGPFPLVRSNGRRVGRKIASRTCHHRSAANQRSRYGGHSPAACNPRSLRGNPGRRSLMSGRTMTNRGPVQGVGRMRPSRSGAIPCLPLQCVPSP